MLFIFTSKLPSGVMEGWNTKLLRIKKHQHKEPLLRGFPQNMEHKTILMCDSLFSRETSTERASKPNHPHSNKRNQRLNALSKNKSKNDQDS